MAKQQWVTEIPNEQWDVYLPVLDELRLREIPFAFGGAFGLATYTHHWRNTKDLDIYVCPDDREEVISIFSEKGFSDYYEILPYVREWIYRGHQGDIILDVMWAMANQRAQVDKSWLMHGEPVEVKGITYHALPAEELIWAKIYVLQRERSDWPDVLNIIYAKGPALDWNRMIERMGDDLPLLRAVMSLFQWLDPAKAGEFPKWLWSRLHLPEPAALSFSKDIEHRRTLLDTRPWFLPDLEDELD